MDEPNYADEEKYPFKIRCFFVDYNREPGEEDSGMAIHWRCGARFVFDPEADLASRTLCKYHRYMPQQFPRETWTQGPRAVERAVRSLTTMPVAEGEKESELTREERDAIARRKAEQRRRAEEAGLLPLREPGDDDA